MARLEENEILFYSKSWTLFLDGRLKLKIIKFMKMMDLGGNSSNENFMEQNVLNDMEQLQSIFLCIKNCTLTHYQIMDIIPFGIISGGLKQWKMNH